MTTEFLICLLFSDLRFPVLSLSICLILLWHSRFLSPFSSPPSHLHILFLQVIRSLQDKISTGYSTSDFLQETETVNPSMILRVISFPVCFPYILKVRERTLNVNWSQSVGNLFKISFIDFNLVSESFFFTPTNNNLHLSRYKTFLIPFPICLGQGCLVQLRLLLYSSGGVNTYSFLPAPTPWSYTNSFYWISLLLTYMTYGPTQ